MSRLKIFSFFSGSGFLDLGFELSGYSIDLVNEFSPAFMKAYMYSREKMGLEKPIHGYSNIDINEYLDIRKDELLRLYEHRQNLIQTLKLLDLLTRGYISKSGDLIDQYITLSEKIKKCYSISKKWYITGKSNLLNDMIDILSYNREHEVYILRHCFDIVHKYLNGRRNNGKKQQQEKV